QLDQPPRRPLGKREGVPQHAARPIHPGAEGPGSRPGRAVQEIADIRMIVGTLRPWAADAPSAGENGGRPHGRLRPQALRPDPTLTRDQRRQKSALPAAVETSTATPWAARRRQWGL